MPLHPVDEAHGGPGRSLRVLCGQVAQDVGQPDRQFSKPGVLFEQQQDVVGFLPWRIIRLKPVGLLVP